MRATTFTTRATTFTIVEAVEPRRTWRLRESMAIEGLYKDYVRHSRGQHYLEIIEVHHPDDADWFCDEEEEVFHSFMVHHPPSCAEVSPGDGRDFCMIQCEIDNVGSECFGWPPTDRGDWGDVGERIPFYVEVHEYGYFEREFDVLIEPGLEPDRKQERGSW